ncbi:hypothetical protein G7Y79_00015g037910 [Physcia stellaris]|nr:hypothetical protein G7Y79_00015g037910 [Physcia stellaris]
MSRVLAVFGATGQQGGSIIHHVLNDPELSQKYKIRAITRNPDSKQANLLKAKVEVVQGDVANRASLETALMGVHTAFAMTTPTFGPGGLEIEYNAGKTIADVAIEKGAEYIIFSTLPSTNEISGGKYTKVNPFDAKAKIEQYIRGLPIRSAFFSGGYFMENFQPQTFWYPQKALDGNWTLTRNNSPKTRLPWINALGDTGKFVGAILAEPDKYEGQTFCAATAFYSWEEVAAIMSKTTGKTVIYQQVSPEEYKKSLPLDPDMFLEGFSCHEEFGYYGLESEKAVAWAVENARGSLSTFEDYLTAHPLQLG